MTARQAPKAQDDLIALWMEVARLMKRQAAAATSKDINPLHLYALMMLDKKEGMTMKEFATLLHITSPSATALANRLVEAGFIKRTNDTHNRKLVRLFLTAKGDAHLEQGFTEHAKHLKSILSLLSIKDQADFARILHALHRVLSSGDTPA